MLAARARSWPARGRTRRSHRAGCPRWWPGWYTTDPLPRRARPALPAADARIHEDRGANAEVIDVVANGDDVADDVHSGDMGHGEPGQEARPLPLKKVEPVDCGRPHGDDDVVRPRRGIRELDELENLQPPMTGVLNGLHVDHLPPCVDSPSITDPLSPTRAAVATTLAMQDLVSRPRPLKPYARRYRPRSRLPEHRGPDTIVADHERAGGDDEPAARGARREGALAIDGDRLLEVGGTAALRARYAGVPEIDAAGGLAGHPRSRHPRTPRAGLRLLRRSKHRAGGRNERPRRVRRADRQAAGHLLHLPILRKHVSGRLR